MRVWVLFEDWWQARRGFATCVQVPEEWLETYRKRHVAIGDRILAVYREKSSNKRG